MTVNEKVAALRTAMRKHNIDAYIIPSSDPHQSEYVSEHWKSREWISGFTGSAGTVVITHEHAGLWADSRYFIQAEEQLADSEMELHRMTIGKGLEYDKWLAEQLPTGSVVGINGLLFSKNQLKYISLGFEAKKLKTRTDLQLMDGIWEGRPSLPQAEIFQHDIAFTGKPRSEKLAEIRTEMKRMHCDYYLMSALDEIAWLFNLRGRDVECNPVFYAYALITETETFLFTNINKLLAELQVSLSNDGVELQPYDSLTTYLNTLHLEKTLLLDPFTTSIRLSELVPCKRLERESIVRWKKSVKNDTEIAHFRSTLIKDGVALVHAYRWLEAEVKQRKISEVELGDQLAHFRSQQAHYYGESFFPIVGYKGNGAIVHYRAMPDTCADIEAEGMLLVDSGGQYYDGTTDITRTITLGNPTAEEKEHFTHVLKGHINLADARFPVGTNGVQLDAFARMPLWESGMNYSHGTGHGIGFFLNVHEFPPKFAPTTNGRGATVLKPNMIMSNEPGLYRKDKYGIRTENLMVCVPDIETEFAKFLKFETVTLFPIDTALIDVDLLTKKEKIWFNKYHTTVFEKLAPHLDADATAWLRGKCALLE